MDSSARKHSRHFLARVRHCAPDDVPLLHVLGHLFQFATVSLDRLYILSGHHEQYDVSIEGEACFDNLASGAILTTAHFGSFEIMRVLASERRQFQIRILLDKYHNRDAFAVISKLNPELALNVIDAGAPGVDLALHLASIIKQGEMVGIMSDRVPQGQRFITMPFLDEPAEFPQGPWILAAMVKCPVVFCFGTYEGGLKYRLKFVSIDPNQYEGNLKGCTSGIDRLR